MSAGVANLQAQVESVLGALVKAATVELTRLFESSYGASPLDVDLGPTEGDRGTERSETTGAKRSIGVQVDDDVYWRLELSGVTHSSEGDCVGEEEEQEEEEVNGSLIPTEILHPEDGSPVDPEASPPKEKVAAETMAALELSGFQGESPTEVVLQGTWTEKFNHGSTESPPTKPKPLVIQPDTCDILSGGKMKFVCPLLLQPQSPAPTADAQAEPQQSCVSTAQGTAYSPSPTDGAVTPAQVGVWECVHVSKENKSNFHMKLKLTSPDQKLTRPCAVQLVNILTVPESEMKVQDVEAKGHDAKQHLPKDLRRHQGLHTGHRLCCFAPCGDGVWRLREVVTHTRDGYVCGICGKAFKRRKILRRHERFHTGEKPYSCPSCSKTFALRKSLRRHTRFHTGERPHTCTHCSKSFRLRDNLKAHLRFHTGEKPFRCTSCGKMFRIMRNLERHQCGIFAPSFRIIAGL